MPPGTWTGCAGGIPTATDSVVILAGDIVTLDVSSVTIAGLTTNGGGIGIIGLDGNTLTVNGNVLNDGQIESTVSSTLNINGVSCSTKATLTGSGFLFTADTITVNVTNVDASLLTAHGFGTINVTGTGTARTETVGVAPNTLTFNITQCKSAAVGGVAERISLTPAQQAQLWLREWGLIVAGVVLAVGSVGLRLARKR